MSFLSSTFCRLAWAAPGAAFLSIAGAGLCPSAYADTTFDTPGNVVIADQFNNRVIEVDPNTHDIVWSFGDGSSTAGPTSVVAPNDEERVGWLTLIAGTGTTTNADNRVFFVNQSGDIVWQYGKAGVAGSAHNELNTPVCAVFLPDFDILITDQLNQRVIEVTLDKKIVWQYGRTGKAGIGYDLLNSPNSAELLANGDILIADESNNRVIEVNHDKKVVWSFGSPKDTKKLNGAAFASRLINGDTLITDAGNNRIIQVDQAGKVVWKYVTTDRAGSVAEPNPTRAVRLISGDTLISDQFNDQVIGIDPFTDIVFTQGQIGVSGNGFDQLNAPYDAKVVGDYTGITPPDGFFY